MTPTAIAAPSIEYSQLLPMLIVFGAAIIGVLIEAFAPRGVLYRAQFVLSITALVAALGAVIDLAGTTAIVAVGSVAVDGPALFIQGLVLVVSLLSILLIAERTSALDNTTGRTVSGLDAFAAQASSVPGSVAEKVVTKSGVTQTEVFPLAMFAVGGMMLFPASGDLLTMFIALEVLSLPLYVMCGMARRRRLLSQESALKYFLLGAFSSAFFLYGIALLYGFAGTVDLNGIADAIATAEGDRTLALIGVSLLTVGLLFKIGAVPFHAWTPDVYQGAPLPITGFMAAATKIAAFGALLRIFTVALPEMQSDWRPVLWVVAALTMLIGTIIAVTQTDIIRMLAYSSVAHAGFLLTGIVAATDSSVSATLFYLLAYGFSTLGAFAIVSIVRDSTGELTDVEQWAGLGKSSPLVAGAFALFLLALAGVPLTSGFMAKFAVFSAAIEGGATPLVVIGVISSAIAAIFYTRIVMLMFFTEPRKAGDTHSGAATADSRPLTSVVIGVGVVMTVALGILPQMGLDLAEQASTFVR
ncbi:NADH-quinone oxidoreductase subunit NuoN [Hoyosella rhizosphaerae]|nr:NADH-quinone oxidoreductase subunit NuoN [Hoyosella rhizosphaerae]